MAWPSGIRMRSWPGGRARTRTSLHSRRVGTISRPVVGPPRAYFVQAVAAKETDEAYEGLGWAAWWLDDVGVCSPHATARTVSIRSRPTRRAQHGWRRGLPATSSTSTAPSRWPAAGCGVHAGCSRSSIRGRSTAGWRSLRDTWQAAPATRNGSRSSPSRRRRSGGGSTCPTSRCSAWHSRGPYWCPAPTSRRDAPARRGDRGGARGRGRRPDCGRLGVLLSGHGMLGEIAEHEYLLVIARKR
jgi:hypothetical protein